MKTFYFRQEAVINFTIDAKDEDEAFAMLEGIDPFADGHEVEFEEAELVDVEE